MDKILKAAEGLDALHALVLVVNGSEKHSCAKHLQPPQEQSPRLRHPKHIGCSHQLQHVDPVPVLYCTCTA